MKTSEFIAIINGLRQQANDLQKLANITPADKNKINYYRNKINSFSTFIDGCKNSNNSFGVQQFQTMLDHLSSVRTALNDIIKIAPDNMVSDATINLALIEQNCAGFDVTKGMTLTQCIDNTANKYVAINNEAHKIGDASSSRKMLVVTNANGDVVQGFFTEDRKLFEYAIAQQIKAVASDAVSKNPDNMAIRRWASAINTPYGVAKLASSMLDGPRLDNDFSSGYNVAKLINTGFLINALDLNRLNADPAFRKMAIDIRNCVDKKSQEYKAICRDYNQYSSNPAGGILAKAGSSLAGRSIAMSNVANLLGMPNIVAKAVPMTVNENGKEINGVFMEKAEGHDLGKKTQESLAILGVLPHDAFDGNGLKQLADLQILDFLCQNVDRHSENLLYSLDDNHRLTGVQGIDNDLSFGTAETSYHKSMQNGTPLFGINVISKTTADNIRKLQPETLRAALTGLGLLDEEILAACKRLLTLKIYLDGYVTNGNVAFGSIKVIPDNQWRNYKLKTLADPAANYGCKNIFVAANDIINKSQKFKLDVMIGNEKPTTSEINPVNVADNFTIAQNNNPLSTQELTAIRQKFVEFKARLESNENDAIKANPKYIELKKELDELLKFEHKKEIESAERWHYQAQLIELEKATEKYIQENLQIPFLDIADIAIKTQLEIIKELCDFTDSHETIVRDAILEQEEEELDKIANELKEEQAKFDLIIDTLANQIQEGQPHLKTDEIKELIYNAPVIKSMMDTDEALDDYSELAAKSPASLLNLYTSKMLMLGEKQFTDDMHKALISKLMVANGQKDEAGEDIVPDKQPGGLKISENQHYKNLVSGLETEVANIEKSAGNLEDNKMEPELLARYISKRLILAKVKTLGTKTQTKETLSILKKLANNAADKDGIFVDAIKGTPEIASVIKKFAHCDNVGGKIGNMYEVYLAEVAKRPKTREIDIAKHIVSKMIEKSASYKKGEPLSNTEIESQAKVIMETATYKAVKAECGDMIKYISPEVFYNKFLQTSPDNLDKVLKDTEEIDKHYKDYFSNLNNKLEQVNPKL